MHSRTWTFTDRVESVCSCEWGSETSTIFNVSNWSLCLCVQGKTNFFEKRVGEYSKAKVGSDPAGSAFSLTEDF